MVEPIECHIGNLLKAQGLKLVLAESCSGGLVSHRVTSIPGASEYFLGGVIAYTNEAKIRVLGVNPETLTRHGPVSSETAIAMASSARQLLSADYSPAQVIGLSVTGIAGPGGGTAEKPVGLVWVGISAPGCETARSFLWEGSRRQNIQSSAQAALQLIMDYLNGKIETSR